MCMLQGFQKWNNLTMIIQLFHAILPCTFGSLPELADSAEYQIVSSGTPMTLLESLSMANNDRAARLPTQPSPFLLITQLGRISYASLSRIPHRWRYPSLSPHLPHTAHHSASLWLGMKGVGLQPVRHRGCQGFNSQQLGLPHYSTI